MSSNQVINQFSQFNLSDHEVLTGQTMNHYQKQVIQNMLADYSIEKISLVYTPDNHLGFVQAEAELAGKIGVLKYILECSNSATAEILNRAQTDQ